MGRKRFFKLSVFAAAIVAVLVVLSHIIALGERLMGVHEWVAYAFYALSAALLFVLVLNPLRVILFSPTFSVDALDEKQGRRVRSRAARRVRRLSSVDEKHRQKLRDAKTDEELKSALRDTYEGPIRKAVDQTIVGHSRTAFVTTAISQNGNLDMLAVLITNLRMIRSIVRECGFRPSYAHLTKLAMRVAVVALVAENLEDVDIREALPNRVGEAIRDVPMVRTATNSVFQGISNGMLTARVGIVTRRYLFQDHKLLTTRQMRLNAYKESFTLMPRIVGEGLGAFPKGILDYIVKHFVRNPFKKKGSQA